MNFPDDPELTLLIRLLRCAFSDTFPEDLEWSPTLSGSHFLKLAAKHRVEPFMSARLPGQLHDMLPASVAQSISRSASDNAPRALALSRSLVSLAGELSQRNIPFFSVKGPLLARSIHGDISARPAGDIDLLIQREDVARADRGLRDLLWRRTWPDFELTPRQWSEYQVISHEFKYRNPAGTRVELAWRLEGMGTTPYQALHAVRREVKLGNVTLALLPETTEIHHLFVHGAGHGWFRLFWLLDVALLLQREHDWEQVMIQARARQTELCIWQGVRLVEILLGVPSPAPLRAPASREHEVAWLVSDVFRQLQAREKHKSTATSLLRDARYLFRLRRTWPERIGLLRQWLCSPANWQQFPLPDPCFPIYYPAAPFLWLWRRMRRFDAC